MLSLSLTCSSSHFRQHFQQHRPAETLLAKRLGLKGETTWPQRWFCVRTFSWRLRRSSDAAATCAAAATCSQSGRCLGDLPAAANRRESGAFALTFRLCKNNRSVPLLSSDRQRICFEDLEQTYLLQQRTHQSYPPYLYLLLLLLFLTNRSTHEQQTESSSELSDDMEKRSKSADFISLNHCVTAHR